MLPTFIVRAAMLFPRVEQENKLLLPPQKHHEHSTPTSTSNIMKAFAAKPNLENTKHRNVGNQNKNSQKTGLTDAPVSSDNYAVQNKRVNLKPKTPSHYELVAHAQADDFLGVNNSKQKRKKHQFFKPENTAPAVFDFDPEVIDREWSTQVHKKPQNTYSNKGPDFQCVLS